MCALMGISCGNARYERQAEQAIGVFSDAILSKDYQTLAQIAPPFTSSPDGFHAQLVEALQGYTKWDVKSVDIDGDIAVASVELIGKDDSANIQIPLSRVEDRWIIPEVFRLRTTIDIIPAGPRHGSE